jgi:predicted ATPase/DNA-binding SARP family transcriptional activator
MMVMTIVDIGLLGPLRVHDDGKPLQIRGVRERTLLAALALRAGKAVRTDELVDALWDPEHLPVNAANSLQAAVSRLRRQLIVRGRSPIQMSGAGYALTVGREHVDAFRFERLVNDAAGLGDAVAAASLLGDALELWRGEVMADVEVHGWLGDEGVRLEQLRLHALEEHLSALLEAGGGRALVPDLEQLVARHPLRERFRAQLMTALYRGGRQAEALAVFDETRTMLVDELGVDPSAELRALHHAILNQDPALGGEQSRPASATLPERLTSFIGRDQELAALDELLTTDRLVTMIGPAGVGKTSLAIAAARRHAQRLRREVCFVDLAPLRDRARIAATALAALGFSRDGGQAGEVDPADRLVAYLRHRRVLLLLDNCEHLVVDAARLVERLLLSCPDITLLVTSREVLGVPGEVVWGTPPLRLPTDEIEVEKADAVALFLERARNADPHFRARENDLSQIAAICARLDGLPLAIELAAATVRALPVNEIADRLDDRFRLLRGGARTSVPRHQTLRAAIDWSYGLLPRDEAEMFKRLSVFASPWTITDAEAVCGDSEIPAVAVLPLVLRLVDQSLVARYNGGRFRLLETMRSYAARLIDPDAWKALRTRHVSYFLELAERLGHSPADAALLHRVEAAAEDIGAAIDWATDAGNDIVALRFAGALGWMWATFHITEGRLRLRQIMEWSQTTTSVEYGRALQACAFVDSYMPSPETRQQALRSIALLERFEDVSGAARSRLIAAFIEMMLSGDLVWAAGITDEADAAAAAVGDDWTRALAALTRFRLHLHRGEVTAALDHGRDAYTRFSTLRDPWGVPWTSIWLAVALRTAGRVEEAQGLLAPTAADLPSTSYAASLALQELGNLASLAGRHDDALTAHTRAIALAAQSGVAILLAFAHDAAAFGSRVRGALAEAEEHCRTALTLFDEVGHLTGAAHARCGLGVTQISLGDVALAEGNLLNAAKAAGSTGPDVVAAAAEGLALLWVVTDPHRSALMLGAAQAIREASGVRYGALETDEALRAREESRRRLGDQHFRAAFSDGSRHDLTDLLKAITLDSAR